MFDIIRLTLIVITLLLNASANRQTDYTITLTEFETFQADNGKWYIRDGFHIDNQTGAWLVLCNINVQYFDDKGDLIHEHDLTYHGAIEPYGLQAAHPAEVHQISEHQAQIIKSAAVDLTYASVDKVNENDSYSACDRGN